MTADDRTPLCTYRVQLHAGFDFSSAAAIADYLAELGVSHLYTSPCLQAQAGSKHGYDIVDHHRVSEELGGAAGHARLRRALTARGMGQVLDIVPNHMAINSRRNLWWWDVLENGPSSRYAAYFDVEWDHPEAKLRNTVLLPILGDHYGRVLEAGELQLRREGGAFVLYYHEHSVPIAPRSLDRLLGSAARRSGSDLLSFLADSFGRLPLATATDRESVRRRHRDKEVLRVLVERLCREQPEVAAAIDQIVSEVNGDPDAMDELLGRQNFRLACWRTAARELGYRRFFDISMLAGLRMEDDGVFADTHELVLRWLAERVLDGVRVDHPDGLRNPEEYFRRLRQSNPCPDVWIVAEKILVPGEELPGSWPVDGTTGYDFARLAGGLFVDPESEGPLTRLYVEFTGEPADYGPLAREKKRLALRQLLGSEINRLTSLFVAVCERHRSFRDCTRHELHELLIEVAAALPVYRTYVQPEAGVVSDADRRYVQTAIEAARAQRPDLDPRLFGFFADLLLLRTVGDGDIEGELVARFQQLTGSAMAKGVEDTAFYCYNRLLSLNEVGGDPGCFGVPVEEFHRHFGEARWPRTLLATSTHDTKRSEDVRARISLLSEIPEQWGAAVWRWAQRNERHRRDGMPDRNLEYLFYQTLVGAWPLDRPRAQAYMEKAAREAKVHTSWLRPDGPYEDALRGFVAGALADADFRADLERFLLPLVTPGRINSLAQTLLKLTAPGVPDIYQGTELWDLSLVDPDNRRPVDYGLRRRLLRDLAEVTPEQAWARIEEGLPKLLLLQRTLQLRRRRPELFGPRSRYRALWAAGEKAAHVVAFRRGEALIAIVPRLPIRLADAYEDTRIDLGAGRFRNVLTGDPVAAGENRVAEVLRRFPVALLLDEEAA